MAQAGNIVPLLSTPPQLAGGVVFVVFDEGLKAMRAAAATSKRSHSGPTVVPGSRSRTKPTSHYGLLRTIEQAWRVPLLGHPGAGTGDHRHLEPRLDGPDARLVHDHLVPPQRLPKPRVSTFSLFLRAS